jgi:hypothetical protein
MLENGMTKINGQLDPEGAAVLKAALDPLSAPNPCAAKAGPDPGPAGAARRLVEICRRAVAADGAAPATTKAQVVVSIGLETLTGAIRGAGQTLDRQVLSVQTVRKLAWDASIIPMAPQVPGTAWTWDAPNDWSPPACSPPVRETGAAPTPAADDHRCGLTPTTSNTGRTADLPR